MKLLTKELLIEYGFREDQQRSATAPEVLSRDKMDAVVKNGRFYYPNTAFDYPLKDIATPRKLYKELSKEELKPR